MIWDADMDKGKPDHIRTQEDEIKSISDHERD